MSRASLEGSFATLPLLSRGRKLRLNVQTQVAGNQPKAPVKPLQGRSFSDCDPITGDHLDHVVTWKREEELGHESGQPVTLRIRMKAAKLFALELI